MAGDLVNPDGTPWTPAFEGQRPPFQPGNDLARTHGIYSMAIAGPIADRFYNGIMQDDDLAILRTNKFQNAVRGYCNALAKVEMLEDWVSIMPIQQAADSDRGKISPLELLRKWQATVDTKAARLGLDPASWAKIHRDVAAARVDLAMLLSDRSPESNTPSTE